MSSVADRRVCGIGGSYPVLLFYKFTPIDDPAPFADEQRALCTSLRLKGRVLIAREGINGTLVGAAADTDRYCTALRTDRRFSDIEFKISGGAPDTFPKLAVKARREIVTLNLTEEVDVPNSTQRHLTPLEWKAALADPKDDFLLLDVRNRYEWEAGRFEGAVTSPIENFRELPEYLEQISHLKEKKVLMYCTGGIRCEKAAALFEREGFNNVYQLHGGIMSYQEHLGLEHWEGDCFVFDQRMTLPGQPEPIGRCAHTGRPARKFVNCLHDPCHKLFLVAPETLEESSRYRLCLDCLAAGLTEETADYKGSRARDPMR